MIALVSFIWMERTERFLKIMVALWSIVKFGRLFELQFPPIQKELHLLNLPIGKLPCPSSG